MFCTHYCWHLLFTVGPLRAVCIEVCSSTSKEPNNRRPSARGFCLVAFFVLSCGKGNEDGIRDENKMIKSKVKGKLADW